MRSVNHRVLQMQKNSSGSCEVEMNGQTDMFSIKTSTYFFAIKAQLLGDTKVELFQAVLHRNGGPNFGFMKS